MVAKSVRYNARSLQTMMEQLQDWIDQTQETLDNEESKDYPNDERVDMLTLRLDQLQQAYDALEAID